MTLKEVATYLSVSEAQVYALVRSGELPAIKIGGRGVWRVDPRRLNAYVQRLQDETAQRIASRPLVQQRRPQGLHIVGPRPLPADADTVSTIEAARIIGVTRQNVSHLIHTGTLRARRDGNRWLVSADDARAYRALGRPRGQEE